MTVYDFLDMFLDILDEVTIYDCEQGKEVWKGDKDDMPDEYADAEVSSVDYPPTHFEGLTININ